MDSTGRDFGRLRRGRLPEPGILSVSESNESHPRENRTGEYGDCPDVIHQISGGDLPVDNAASS